MPRPPLPCAVILLFSTAPALTGCSSKPPPQGSAAQAAPGDAGDVKAVAPPAELVGKWRHEVTEGADSRTSVYHFTKDGRLEVDTRLDTPDHKVTDLVKRAVVKVEGDRITVVDVSRTSAEGVEDAIPPERRRPRTYRVRVKGDELHWSEVDEQDKPSPKPRVLKRVTE